MLALFLLPLLAATLTKSLTEYNYDYQDEAIGEEREDCDCGRTRVGGGQRIVGGTEVDHHSLPHMALLKIKFPPFNSSFTQNQAFRCGGTLINRRYILTARHCIQDPVFRENFIAIDVKLGVHNSTDTGDHVQNYKLTKKDVILFPKLMENDTLENDIMLLRLDKDVSFTDRIHPACLPKDISQKYDSGEVFVAGWGKIQDRGRMSQVLKKTTIQLFPLENRMCKNTAEKYFTKEMPKSQLCAYGQDTDSCAGDSGGPLIKMENGRYTVIGLVSYGYICASRNHAGIYTRVTSFMKWIKNVVKDGQCGAKLESESESISKSESTWESKSESKSEAKSESKLESESESKSKSIPATAQLCDVSCNPKTKKLTTLDRIYKRDGSRFACYKGQCYAKDGSDFCAKLLRPYPCGNPNRGKIGELECRYPCNLAKSGLKWFISRYQAGELPRLINLKAKIVNVGPANADCDLSTGYCCPYTPPGKKPLPGTSCYSKWFSKYRIL